MSDTFPAHKSEVHRQTDHPAVLSANYIRKCSFNVFHIKIAPNVASNFKVTLSMKLNNLNEPILTTFPRWPGRFVGSVPDWKLPQTTMTSRRSSPTVAYSSNSNLCGLLYKNHLFQLSPFQGLYIDDSRFCSRSLGRSRWRCFRLMSDQTNHSTRRVVTVHNFSRSSCGCYKCRFV